MFSNIIKILVSDLSNSQRIRRSTSLIKDLESRAKKQSQNLMPSYQAEPESEAKLSASKSINLSLKAVVSEARAFEPVASANSARARVKDIKKSRSEFSVFSRLSSIRRQRMFYQFLHKYPNTQVFTVSFDYLPTSQRKFYSVFLRSLSANITSRVFLLCSITFIAEVKEYKISFLGAFPKADMKKAAVTISSKFSCDYISEGDYG